MQKKKIISTYLSLANYVADTIAKEIKKNYKNLNIKSYKKTSRYQVVTKLDLKIIQTKFLQMKKNEQPLC